MTATAIQMSGLLETEYFDVESNIVDDTFRIFVAKPPFASESTHDVIYVADGNTLFTQVLGIQRMLAWGAQSPPAFIVGIGYPTERGFIAAINKRNRDFAPTDGGAYAREVLGTLERPGADRFNCFLAEELRPLLEARYPIRHDAATFVGASLAGLFGAWALLQERPLFRRFVLTSPALWWNDEEVWDWEQRRYAAQKDLHATVFVSAGGLEFGTALREHALTIASRNPLLRDQVQGTIAWHDRHGWPETTDLTQRFAQQLQARSYGGLRIHCHNMPDETHMSVAPAAISRGLRYVFDDWQPW